MARINTRLAELEKKLQPGKEIMVIYKHDDKYWRATDCDYRQVIGGEGCTFLTLEEVQALERTYDVIMVEWVKYENAYSTLGSALTEIAGEEVDPAELPGLIHDATKGRK